MGSSANSLLEDFSCWKHVRKGYFWACADIRRSSASFCACTACFYLVDWHMQFFSLWQPSCPYRQHKLGEVAEINNFSCISTAAGAAWGLPAW